jgi:hypothetical protein
MEVSGQLHVPAVLFPVKEHSVPIWQGWLVPRVGLDAELKRKKSQPLKQKNKISTLHRVS